MRRNCQAGKRGPVGDDDAVDRGIHDGSLGARHEQAMGDQRHYSLGAGPPRRLRRADQRTAGADEVVNDQRGCARDVADEKIAGDDAGAAALVGKSFADGPSQRAFQRFAKQVGAFGAARPRT